MNIKIFPAIASWDYVFRKNEILKRFAGRSAQNSLRITQGHYLLRIATELKRNWNIEMALYAWMYVA